VKILIVDDNIHNIEMAAVTVELAGHEPVSVYSGYDALDIMAQDNVRLLLVDWMMPEMDGIELIKRIRAQFSDRYIYIIMLTAKESQDDIVTGLEVGADDYVVKPFLPRELRARIGIGVRIIEMESRLSDHLEHMENLATRDHLTKLYNRRRFLELAEKSFEDHSPFSLFMLDVDHFKQINDRFGHPAGDKVLVQVADLVNDQLQDMGIIGRYGGEEFIGILPDRASDEATTLVETLCKSIEETPIKLAVENIQITASIGIVTCNGNNKNDCTVHDLIHRADEALYRAKNNGRNRVEIAD